jgi:hypothetical protein
MIRLLAMIPTGPALGRGPYHRWHLPLPLGDKQTCARQCRPLEGLISKMWFEA